MSLLSRAKDNKLMTKKQNTPIQKKIEDLEKRIEFLENRQCNHVVNIMPPQVLPIQQLWKCQICGLNQCKGHFTY